MTAGNDLIARWRREAEMLNRRGADQQAVAVESCADDFKEWWLDYWTEPLTYVQAASEADRSYSWVQKGVASGELPNVGEKHAPRVPRYALFPGLAPIEREEGDDLADEVLVRRILG